MLVLAARGVPQQDYVAVLAENDSLRQEIEDLRFGAERLIAQSRQAMAGGEDERG